MTVNVGRHGWSVGASTWPDATNTGVDGTTLTAVPGSLTSGTGWEWDEFDRVRVTGADAVLENLDIDGPVVVDADGVTINNCRVTLSPADGNDQDCILIRASEGGGNCTITNCTLDGSGSAYRGRSNIRTSGNVPMVIARYNDCYGCGNGITIEYEGIAEHNWVHDLGHVDGDHHSGLSNHGGASTTGVTYRHNTVLLHTDVWPDDPLDGGVSGAITCYSDFAPAQYMTIDNNLISGGSYTVYCGESGGAWVSGAVNHIVITDNHFLEGEWIYGPYATYNATRTGNVISGNVDHVDGSAINYPYP